MNTDLQSKDSKSASNKQIVLCQDKDDLADKAARVMVKIIKDALEGSSKCNIALSGGSTPSSLYKRLLAPDMTSALDWSKLDFYVSDERCVSHESMDSNWGNACREFLSPRGIKSSQMHPTANQDKDPKEAAYIYDELIRRNINPGSAGIPKFDIVFLGVGTDGHTASLFPGTTALEEEFDLVVSNHVPKLNCDRITFTFPLINAARNVIVLVSGRDKNPVINQVLKEGPQIYPCQRVSPKDGQLIWIVDRAAANDTDF